MSCCCRHPSKLHDNMMPMSPDDYRALTQMVNPEDMAAMVSAAALTRRCYPSMLICRFKCAIHMIKARPLFRFSMFFQADNVIHGFGAFDVQVDAD